MRCRSCVGQLDAIGVRVSDEVGINTEDFSLLASIGAILPAASSRNHCHLALGRISAHTEETR
jgi:hypothetical protein